MPLEDGGQAAGVQHQDGGLALDGGCVAQGKGDVLSLLSVRKLCMAGVEWGWGGTRCGWAGGGGEVG